MQRRQFLEDVLSLGATGLMFPGIGIAIDYIPNKTELLRDGVAQCTPCYNLVLTCTQSFESGNPDVGLCFLSEAPRTFDDKPNNPFFGRRGNASIRRQLFDGIITKFLSLRREDVIIRNIYCCRHSESRTLYQQESPHYRPVLDDVLKIVNPKFICCLGTVAMQSLFGRDKTLQLLRGEVHHYNGIPVVCTYHPTYLLRDSHARKEMWSDIQFLKEKMDADALTYISEMERKRRD